MNEAVERCRWLGEKEDLAGHTGRVYLGDEGCPRFLGDADFPGHIKWIQNNGYKITLTVPFLTPAWVEPAAALLRAIPRPVEVACGDVGALALAAESIHTPVAGRLLSRQCTDPAVAGFRQPVADQTIPWDRTVPEDRMILDRDGPALLRHRPPPDSLWERWQTPPIFASGALAAYRAAIGGGPLRVEVDLPLHGLPSSPPDCPVTVHTGEVLVSVSACTGACERCPSGAVLLGRTRAGVDIWRRRNILFYRSAAGIIPKWCDREVRHP